MALQESKFVEWNGNFISALPNASYNHIIFSVDKYGKTVRVGTIRTDKLPTEILKKIINERPWGREKILHSLEYLGAASLLKIIEADSNGKRE